MPANFAAASQGLLKTWRQQQQQWCWPPAEKPTVALDPLTLREGQCHVIFVHLHLQLYFIFTFEFCTPK